MLFVFKNDGKRLKALIKAVKYKVSEYKTLQYCVHNDDGLKFLDPSLT